MIIMIMMIMIIMIMMIMMTVKSILYRWTLLDQGELETQEEEVGFDQVTSYHITLSYRVFFFTGTPLKS